MNSQCVCVWGGINEVHNDGVWVGKGKGAGSVGKSFATDNWTLQ